MVILNDTDDADSTADGDYGTAHNDQKADRTHPGDFSQSIIYKFINTTNI